MGSVLPIMGQSGEKGLTVGLDVALVALDVVNLGGVEDLCWQVVLACAAE
jgi:hypothetical protein